MKTRSMKIILSVLALVSAASLAMAAGPGQGQPQQQQPQQQQSQQKQPQPQQQQKQPYISADQAKGFALKHAGLKDSQVQFHNAARADKQSQTLYNVEFTSGNTRYSYEVNAVSGLIMGASQKTVQGNIQGNKPGNANPDYNKNQVIDRNPPMGASSGYIGGGKAQQIAFKNANVKNSQNVKPDMQLMRNNGRDVYNVEFNVGNAIFHYIIDAITGNIIESKNTPGR